jgi:hypothetical protein
MLDKFFLNADEYRDVQACRLLQWAKTTDDRPLLDVQITPTLPGELVREESEISRLLLGFVNPAYKLEDIEKGNFGVDIYAPKSGVSKDVYDPRELIKIGVGALYPTFDEAFDWNVRNKL